MYTLLDSNGLAYQFIFLVLLIYIPMNRRVSRSELLILLLIILYVALEMSGHLFGLLDIASKSLLLALLTIFSFLLAGSKVRHCKGRLHFVQYSVFTVPISIVISIFGDFGIPIERANSSAVLGVDRLTYFFAEPSHYAIFLAFSLSAAIKLKVGRFQQFILLIGLLLTWSLSGYLLFTFLVYQAASVIRPSLHWFMLVPVVVGFFVMLGMSSSITSLDSNFIILNKIATLIQYFEGDASVSSAGVRMYSTFLGPIYLLEKFNEGSYFNLFFGEGFGGHKAWILDKFGGAFTSDSIRREATYNYLSSIVISGGAIFLLLYLGVLFLITSTVTQGKHQAVLYMSTFFVLSLISGYAFGMTAFLFISLAFMNATPPIYRYGRIYALATK